MAKVQPVVLVHHQYLVVVAHGRAGQADNILHLAPLDLSLHEHSHRYRQGVLAVDIHGQPRHPVQHARALVELRLQAHQFALPQQARIAEVGGYGHRRPQGRRYLAARGRRQAQVNQLIRRQRQAHFDIVGGVDRAYALAAAEELAEIDLLVAHQAVEGRPQLGAFQVAPGLVEGGAALRQVGRGDIRGAAGGVELLLAGQLFTAQALHALEFVAGELVFHLGSLQGCLGAGERRLVVGVVYAQQDFIARKGAAAHQ